MKRAATDFFALASAKAPRAGAAWRVVREGAGVYMLRADPAVAPSPKVAAFDMARRRCFAVSHHAASLARLRPEALRPPRRRAQDGTLVVTKSGGSFARDAGDWKMLHASCVDAIRLLHAAGYRIVVFRRAGAGQPCAACAAGRGCAWLRSAKAHKALPP